MGLRCLIVDDSLGFLQAARALLEQDGMTVVGVAAGTGLTDSARPAVRPVSAGVRFR
jgi:two-component system, NarL family, nitrate/nitrite response regulator NarL